MREGRGASKKVSSSYWYSSTAWNQLYSCPSEAKAPDTNAKSRKKNCSPHNHFWLQRRLFVWGWKAAEFYLIQAHRRSLSRKSFPEPMRGKRRRRCHRHSWFGVLMCHSFGMLIKHLVNRAIDFCPHRSGGVSPVPATLPPPLAVGLFLSRVFICCCHPQKDSDVWAKKYQGKRSQTMASALKRQKIITSSELLTSDVSLNKTVAIKFAHSCMLLMSEGDYFCMSRRPHALIISI